MIQGGYSNFDPDLDWRLERAFQKGWKERFKKLFRSQADKKSTSRWQYCRCVKKSRTIAQNHQFSFNKWGVASLTPKEGDESATSFKT